MGVLLEAKAQVRDAEQKVSAASGLPKDSSGSPDYSEDFFGRNAFLAVSGQLNAEAYACALTDVYTFGKSYRSHHSESMCFCCSLSIPKTAACRACPTQIADKPFPKLYFQRVFVNLVLPAAQGLKIKHVTGSHVECYKASRRRSKLQVIR